jgi:hypothetical protein
LHVILETLQNITVAGLAGSETTMTHELQLANADAQGFTSAFFINVTNYSHGAIQHGSIAYRRTETTLSLDRGAPPIDDFFVGRYLTVGNESRTIVGYNVLREVTIDRPFVGYKFLSDILQLTDAQVAARFSPTDPANKYVITTGDVYPVWMESKGTAIWLQRAGCTLRPINNVQTCSRYDGTLVLRANRRIPANSPTVISFVLVNNALPQLGFVPHISASALDRADSTAIPLQNFTHRVLESRLTPAMQVAHVGSSSQVPLCMSPHSLVLV